MSRRSALNPIYPPNMSFWQAMQAGMVRPIESESYLSWVRTRPCVITGRPATAHHMVGHGLKPNGGKTSDILAFPLCEEYHLPDYPNGLHHMGHKRWEMIHGDQRIYVMQTLVEAIYCGVLKL